LCDEAEGVNIATETIEKDINSVLSNSFGFGGTNASLVISNYK
jgi:3-oxoacyl-[acyl-carrier-protein] synthase-1